MSTITENNGKTEFGYDKRVIMKGASEQILNCCQYYLNENGDKLVLDDAEKSEFKANIEEYASQSLRTISLAYKDL